MGKDFPDPGNYAYKPSMPDDVPSVIKIVPSMPASQSERPQLRPVVSPTGD